MDSHDRTGAFSGQFPESSRPHPARPAAPAAAVAAPPFAAGLPAEPDCETAALLRMVVLPQIEAAYSWADLVSRLNAKGFGLGFRAGRMILSRLDSGAEVCTGRSVGAPLRALALRLGRPALRLSPDGQSAQLQS